MKAILAGLLALSFTASAQADAFNQARALGMARVLLSDQLKNLLKENADLGILEEIGTHVTPTLDVANYYELKFVNYANLSGKTCIFIARVDGNKGAGYIDIYPDKQCD